MINPIEWFKQKGFSFDDERITVRDAIELQLDAKEEGISVAQDLYDAACSLMRHQQDKSCWHNLQNAAARWESARQTVRNDIICNLEFRTSLDDENLRSWNREGCPPRKDDSASLAPLNPSCSGSESL